MGFQFIVTIFVNNFLFILIIQSFRCFTSRGKNDTHQIKYGNSATDYYYEVQTRQYSFKVSNFNSERLLYKLQGLKMIT